MNYESSLLLSESLQYKIKVKQIGQTNYIHVLSSFPQLLTVNLGIVLVIHFIQWFFDL